MLARGAHSRHGAGQTQPDASLGPCGARDRQRLTGPAVEGFDRLAHRHGEPQGFLGPRPWEHLERDFSDDPEDSHRAAQQARHVEPCDVLHHLPAEAQQLAVCTEERCAQHEVRSEEHTSELQSLAYLVCRLLLEKKKKMTDTVYIDL